MQSSAKVNDFKKTSKHHNQKNANILEHNHRNMVIFFRKNDDLSSQSQKAINWSHCINQSVFNVFFSRNFAHVAQKP